MINRIWDPGNKYPAGHLKEYNHWVVEISYRQHTLGCFIIFAKRNVEKISDITNAEAVELTHVMKDMENVYAKIPELRPERFNYLQMGNALHHLHFHAIPRYSSKRNFQDKIWIDTAWGNPPVWSTYDEDVTFIREIQNLILKYFN